jgi:hypothetical protein
MATKVLLTLLITLLGLGWTEEPTGEEQSITQFLTRLYQARHEVLLQENKDQLSAYYVISNEAGRMTLEHELRRSQYIRVWAEKRSIQLTKSQGKITIERIRQNGSLARVQLVQSVKLSYTYPLHPQIPAQSFGIGTRHRLILQRMNGQWRLLQDDYLDPLYVNPDLIPAEGVPGFPSLPTAQNPSEPLSPPRSSSATAYREKAVAYANRYAGAAWGAGNQGRYNRKYQDYTDAGGDCTNFISQVWGDAAEGGRLPTTDQWHYEPGKGGSSAWIYTDLFKKFLITSRHGKLIAQGTFREVVQSTSEHPEGAIARLQPGDLIAYAFNNDVDHFAVVVGRDQNGYPLVNSHTSDRYHMPFDLGWTRRTHYLLFHIQEKP